MFLKYYTLSNMIFFDILEKDPSKQQKIIDGAKPISAILTVIQKGFNHAIFNQNASKWVKVAEAFFKFMEKEAKASGISYVKEVPKPKSNRT